MSFKKDFAKFKEKTDRKVNAVFRTASLVLFGKIIIRTPVDTGRLRANWQASLNNPKKSQVESTDKKRGIDEANRVAKHLDSNDSFYLTNNLPYAEAIENGWSGQAPKGMVKVSALEWKRIVNAATRREAAKK